MINKWGMWDSPVFLEMKMLFTIGKAAILKPGIAHLFRNRCGIVHLSHFVKTKFDKLPKEDSKRLI